MTCVITLSDIRVILQSIHGLCGSSRVIPQPGLGLPATATVNSDISMQSMVETISMWLATVAQLRVVVSVHFLVAQNSVLIHEQLKGDAPLSGLGLPAAAHLHLHLQGYQRLVIATQVKVVIHGWGGSNV